jgi:hypothetical protein
MENSLAVSFDYRCGNGENEHVICHPVDFTTNVSDNWIYMNSAEGNCYRLDRFKSPCKNAAHAGPAPEYIENPKKKYAWGSYFNDTEEPTHVKVRIADETQNIINKIQNDIKYRRQTSKFYKEGNFYYFEDDVIGLGEFQRWVRGYGSSILVLEPKEMQENIVTNAHRILDLYEKSNEWKNI